MEPYQKRKRRLKEKYGKPINVKLLNDEVVNKSENEKYVQLIADITNITDEEGLKQANESKDGLHQHSDKLFVAGTRDWPGDAIDDLKSPINDTLNKIQRGRDSDAYYRNHHEIDTVIGHSLGGVVALSLENNIKKKGITLMELFNLKHSVRLQYQVIVQAPTLIELDGLVTLFQHLTLIAQQLYHHSNSDGEIARIHTLAYVLRMLFQFMMLKRIHCNLPQMTKMQK